MRRATALGIVIGVLLLVNVFIGEARLAWTLLPVHIALGATAFGASIFYSVISRGYRPAVIFGALLVVLIGLQGTLGLMMVFGLHGQLIETAHRFAGNASFLIGLVGGIVVGRMYRRATSSTGQQPLLTSPS
ncbi:MAG: hypothetical protein NZ988_01950 [Thaumarchaeota archaeon]|nr:hypothetical protein [Candidatus Calditenuaceae archaeon]MDW8186799.1 hypothetical protein [Nitrososphaerota archaeon]